MKIIDSVYGEIEFTGSTIQVIHSHPVQKLKNIHQNGAIFLVYPAIQTSRFDHSLGVCHLIKILGGSEKEQIAGLLHDVSHTAFSHVVDYVLENVHEDFHEKNKLRFLLNEDLSRILHSLELNPKEFFNDDKFSLLEARLPLLCADRIDYTLRDLVAWGKISQQEAQEFVHSLRVIKGKIIVESIYWGQWFKNNYEYLNDRFFSNHQNIFVNLEFAKLLKKGLSMNLFSVEDFFEDDNFIINRIIQHTVLRKHLEQIKTQLKNKDYTSYSIKFKDRIVDPLIMNHGKAVPLSKCVGS